MYDVCVVGLGYIGLPTATFLASRGLNVLGVDTNPVVLKVLGSGDIHIVEPGLKEVAAPLLNSGKLVVSDKAAKARVFIIAVPTPIGIDKSPDLSFVANAFDSIALVVERGDLVILESTSPVGTTAQMAERLRNRRSDLNIAVEEMNSPPDVSIAYCPERVLPGRVLDELNSNDRVIGGLTPNCADKAAAFYTPLIEGECFSTNARTAELSKLAENSFRDVNIAFANELSLICEEANINVRELITLVNRHPRVNVLSPGPGVGGHCIAVDPWFIVNSYPRSANLIAQARVTNDAKPHWVATQIIDWAKRTRVASGDDPTIGVFGLSFKPNIDDVRESPAVVILHKLIDAGLTVEVSEPHLSQYESFVLADPDKLCQRSSLCVFLVAHDQFRRLRPSGDFMDFCGALDSGVSK